MKKYILLVATVLMFGCSSMSDSTYATGADPFASHPELLKCRMSATPVCRETRSGPNASLTNCRCEQLSYSLGGAPFRRMPLRR
jgi:hypothetical protein